MKDVYLDLIIGLGVFSQEWYFCLVDFLKSQKSSFLLILPSILYPIRELNVHRHARKDL